MRFCSLYPEYFQEINEKDIKLAVKCIRKEKLLDKDGFQETSLTLIFHISCHFSITILFTNKKAPMNAKMKYFL